MGRPIKKGRMELSKEVDKEVCQQLEQLAEAGAILENGGHGDKVLGHLSTGDPRGRGVLDEEVWH